MRNNIQKIRCDVDNCKYNNFDDKMCKLSEIKVSRGCKESGCKDNTVCDSFIEEKE